MNHHSSQLVLCALSPTQSPAELRVQYPTMPQLLRGIEKLVKTLQYTTESVREPYASQLSSAPKVRTVVGAHRAASSASQLKSVSYLELPSEHGQCIILFYYFEENLSNCFSVLLFRFCFSDSFVLTSY